jgi:hypothetical protein
MLTGKLTLDNGIIINDSYIKIRDITFSYCNFEDSTSTDISEVIIRVEIYRDIYEYENKTPYLILAHKCDGYDIETYFPDYEFHNGSTPIILAYEWLINEIYQDMDII